MLTPWKESYDQPRKHIQKQRHYFANKDSSSQAMVFPVVMYGCESWTVKKAEGWRIDAFKLWWRKFLRVPWTARRSKQSLLKEINLEFIGRTDAEAENSNTLDTWCEELTPWKILWCWKRLRAEGEEGVRGWDDWMESPMQWTWTWANFRRWWGKRRPDVLQSLGLQRVGHDGVTKEQQHFIAHFFQIWSQGTLSVGPYASLIYPKHCIPLPPHSSLLSGNIRCFRFVLCSSCFSTRISHFSKKRWFLLLENGIRHQNLGNTCAHPSEESCF